MSFGRSVEREPRRQLQSRWCLHNWAGSAGRKLRMKEEIFDMGGTDRPGTCHWIWCQSSPASPGPRRGSRVGRRSQPEDSTREGTFPPHSSSTAPFECGTQTCRLPGMNDASHYVFEPNLGLGLAGSEKSKYIAVMIKSWDKSDIFWNPQGAYITAMLLFCFLGPCKSLP